jgi:hypothetical protein
MRLKLHVFSLLLVGFYDVFLTYIKTLILHEAD